jgi:hypothetical protein
LSFLATSSALIFSSWSLRLRSSDDDIRLFRINKDMLKKISDYDQRPTCKETNCQRFDVNGNSMTVNMAAG